MELTNKVETKEIEINGEKIEVKNRISSARKIAIIATCLKESSSDGIYNKLAYETSIYTMLVLSYTNIANKINNFTEDNLPLMELYDEFDSNGIIENVITEIESMNKGETTTFLTYATEMYDEAKESANSIGYGLANLAGTLSATFGDITHILSSIAEDPEMKDKISSAINTLEDKTDKTKN